MNFWKKIGVIGLSVLFILPFAGCKKENEELKYLNYGRLIAPLALMDFDHQTVETQNAYGTLYFGLHVPAKSFESVMESEEGEAEPIFYAQAFFSTAERSYLVSDAIQRKIKSIDALHAGKVTDEIFRGKTYIVHAENDYLPYLAGEYDVEKIHKLPVGKGWDWDEDVYFHHSQRVHIPSEFFTEPSGSFSFHYYLTVYKNEVFMNYQSASLTVNYELSDNNVTFKQKTVITDCLSGHPITNLDGKIFRRS